MESLFEYDGQAGSLYEALRTSDHPAERSAHERIDNLWSVFEPYADDHFAQEFRLQTHSRYWEMYLTCMMLDQGRDIECPKPGPDILVHEDRGKVWIEAVTASQGVLESADRVPDVEPGVAFTYPEDQILLRYRNAIEEKTQKFTHYVKSAIVSITDACVIAVHSGGIPLTFIDHEVPDIVKAVLPLGLEQITRRVSDGAFINSGYQYRSNITKSSGSKVATDIFLNPAYAAISAVLFSSANISNPPQAMGSDLILVHNPKAAVPLPSGWLGVGMEFSAYSADRGFELKRIVHSV